ncbi:hypothetical protein MMC17_000161 [Xylographa soralifera]|nr:hypothetical protein [Xylographa soralifera]
MDGGVRQQSIHKQIKATVASVTRMKRMIKGANSQPRENYLPSPRDALPDSSDGDDRSVFDFQDDSLFTAPSSATTSEPASGFDFRNYAGCESLIENPINRRLIDATNGFAPLYKEPLTPIDDTWSSDPSFLCNSNPPVEFHSMPTPQRHTSGSPGNTTGNTVQHSCPSQPSVLFSVPEIWTMEHPVDLSRNEQTQSSITRNSSISDRDLNLASCTSTETDLLYIPHNTPVQEGRRASSIAEHRLSPFDNTRRPLRQASDSRVKSSSDTPAISSQFSNAGTRSYAKEIGDLSDHRSRSRANSQKPPEAISFDLVFSTEKSSRLKIATKQLAKYAETLGDPTKWQHQFQNAITWIVPIMDDYIQECQLRPDGVLEEKEFQSLRSILRHVVWLDVISRSFNTTQATSPFQGHISQLLDTGNDDRAANGGLGVPTENWIITAIESVNALSRLSSQNDTGGGLGTRDFGNRAVVVQSSLEYYLTSDDDLAFGNTPAAMTLLCRAIFLHSLFIYYHVVVLGPFSESPEIRRSVGLVMRNLIALDDPHVLSGSLVWPLCITGCLSGPEHHETLTGLCKAAANATQHSNPRLDHALAIMQECWKLRGRGVHAEWRMAQASLERRGEIKDMFCW